MRFQSFKREKQVVFKKTRVTVVFLMFLAWITLMLLLYFLPPSTYPDLNQGWILLLYVLAIFLFVFSFPAFAYQPPKWVVKLMEKRFSIEFLFILFNLYLLFLPIRKRHHFYWLIYSDTPPVLLKIFFDGLTIFLIFFTLAAAWFRIDSLLKKKSALVRSELVFPTYTSQQIKLSFFALFGTLILLIASSIYVSVTFHQELEDWFGVQALLVFSKHIQFLIFTCLVLFVLPPIACYLRAQKFRGKFWPINFLLIFIVYFSHLFPLFSYGNYEKFLSHTTPSWILLIFSSLSIVIHLVFVINLVVRYHVLLAAEESFKIQQKEGEQHTL